MTLLTAADRLSARGEGALASDEMIEAHLELVREMLPAALDWQRDGARAAARRRRARRRGRDRAGPGDGRILEELRAATFAGEISGPRGTALARELAPG